MPEYCTCGAELPPEARFCHKCGKPQREETWNVEEEPAKASDQARPAAQPVVSVAIDFHNAVAVRLGFMAATIASLLTFLLAYAFPLWLTGAGFLGAYIYRKRTGEKLSVKSGLRMGWITGVFSFVLLTALFTLSFVVLMSSGMFDALMHQGLMRMGATNQAATDMIRVLRSPAGITAELIFLFAVSTVCPMMGGALGAKLARN